MSRHILGLDNVASICNIDKSEYLKFEKMGFTLYPLGRQGLKLGFFFLKSGTGSIAVNFKYGGYYEMISIYNKFLLTGGYKKILRTRGERLIKATLSIDNAKKEAKRVNLLGKKAFGPLEFRRVFFSKTKGKQDSRFLILAYPFPADYPIAIAGTQHLNPEITWQNDLLDHANGALMLSNVLMVFENLEKEIEYYKKIWDVKFEEEGKSIVCYFKNGSRMTFINSADLNQYISGIKIDSSPFIAAVYFAVKDIQIVKDLFKENNIPYEEKDEKLIVHRDYVFNSTFVFEQCKTPLSQLKPM